MTKRPTRCGRFREEKNEDDLDLVDGDVPALNASNIDHRSGAQVIFMSQNYALMPTEAELNNAQSRDPYYEAYGKWQ